MTKIILVNGPPGSGKDTVYEAVKQIPGLLRKKFAGAVKLGVHRAFGFPTRDIFYYEDCKDIPNEDFYGATPREAYIAYSENFMKPLTKNEGIFGKITSNEIKIIPLPFRHIVVITDSGFADEARVIIKEFGADNVMLIRLHRKGHTFEGDSRGYILLPEVDSVDVYNNDIGVFKSAVSVLIEDFIR